jgi:hypothetical protein
VCTATPPSLQIRCRIRCAPCGKQVSQPYAKPPVIAPVITLLHEQRLLRHLQAPRRRPNPCNSIARMGSPLADCERYALLLHLLPEMRSAACGPAAATRGLLAVRERNLLLNVPPEVRLALDLLHHHLHRSRRIEHVTALACHLRRRAYCAACPPARQITANVARAGLRLSQLCSAADCAWVCNGGQHCTQTSIGAP